MPNTLKLTPKLTFDELAQLHPRAEMLIRGANQAYLLPDHAPNTICTTPNDAQHTQNAPQRDTCASQNTHDEVLECTFIPADVPIWRQHLVVIAPSSATDTTNVGGTDDE